MGVADGLDKMGGCPADMKSSEELQIFLRVARGVIQPASSLHRDLRDISSPFEQQ
jgi:hypothetical protein